MMSSGLIYLGSNSVWSSEYRLTIPSCVFDDYELLSPEKGGWWIYDEECTVRIANRAPDEFPETAKYCEISGPGERSKTRFFTISKKFREGEPRKLNHDTKIHFVTDTEMASGNRRSFCLFTIGELEDLVDDSSQWTTDPKSISRLIDSEASHLIDETFTEIKQSSHRGPDIQEKTLADKLNIQSEDVPSSFEIKNATVEFLSIPSTIYEDIDIKYLLVRYGTSERTHQNPSEDPKLLINLNKEVDVNTGYSKPNEKIVADVPFCIHNRHALEFKFFADVIGSRDLDEVRDTFMQSPSCRSASISDSLEDRVYMVHDKFSSTETEDGIINNKLYPK